jgi:1-acyl-sn-glycerol-3-phosphate acyltransferase
LQPNDWYLLIANHQTWADIIVLQLVFSLRIPSLRFFMKKELLWQLPIVAQACWVLGYPFVQRYNKDYLKKHPDRKGKDLETTRKICKRFKKTPISLINFSEGGRFNPQRHARQRSPYRYLLKPRAGGIAFILGAMPQMRTLLDVTIIYDKEQASFWDFLSGRLRKITIRVRRIPITDELRGDYTNDVTFRRHFQRRLNQLWQEKDDLIAEIKRGQEKSTL